MNRVRLTTIKKGKDLGVRARTTIGNKTLTADGGDSESAVLLLALKKQRYDERQAFKGQYPQTVEVDLDAVATDYLEGGDDEDSS